MPTLQSFSLPRSGPRVTARPCPPVVLRQHRRDYEALFRSEVRHSRGSWPNRTARCSPGLPLLEPHPNANPSGMPVKGSDEGRRGPARWRADPVAVSATPVPPMPEGWPHRVRGGGRTGRHHCHARCAGTGPSAHHRSGVLAGLSPGRTVVLPSRTRGAPRVRRICASRPLEGERTGDIRGVLDFLAGGSTVEAIDPPSAQPRSVRSAAAVEGVHVADGLIGSRSVTRGRAIGAKTPASARRRKVPPTSSQGAVRSLPRTSLRNGGRAGRQG